MLKRCVKILRQTLLGIIALILFYGATAWLLGHWHVDAEPVSQADVEIYLISNGVHTDIAMPWQHPAFDWSHYAKPDDTISGSSDARYIAIGWGDKGFYLNTPHWRDLTFNTAARAISGFNQTALHVSFYPQLTAGPHIAKIPLSMMQYHRLAHNIAADFQRNAQGSLPIVGAHYQQNDAFYEANGRYSLFYTCNTWSNQQLKRSGAGGVMWTPFADTLLQRFQPPQPR